MLHVPGQNPITTLGLLRSPARRLLPRASFRIRALGEIEIPKSRGDEFGRMVVNADRSAAFVFQLCCSAIECVECLSQLGLVVQRGAYLVSAHLEDVQHSAKPERLVVDSDVLPFVQIYGD